MYICTYIYNKEEAKLNHFLKSYAAIGYGKVRKEIMRIMESYAKIKITRKNKIGQGC